MMAQCGTIPSAEAADGRASRPRDDPAMEPRLRGSNLRRDDQGKQNDTTKRKSVTSGREQERAAMLREALSRPGVREVMDVYSAWWERDRGLDAYRAATKTPARVTRTNHTRTRRAAGPWSIAAP